MSIIEEKIPEIQSTLITKATNRSAIRYAKIFSMFDEDTPNNDIWDTFEEACMRIAPSNEAIYGALMATNKMSLPASGFYDIFKNSRYDEYIEITQGVNLEANQLSISQMKAIAQLERERVHRHAVEIT